MEKKRSNKVFIVIAILVVILIAIAILVYSTVQNKTDDEDDVTTSKVEKSKNKKDKSEKDSTEKEKVEYYSDLSKEDKIGHLTFYVDENWDNIDSDEGNIIHAYYPTEDTSVSFALLVDSSFYNMDAASYIEYLDDSTAKVKKINGYECGVLRNYDENGKETIQYLLFNGNESYVITFGQKKQISKDFEKASDKIISKIIIDEISLTLGQKNALSKADSYLRSLHFSYKGLVEQLEYEGFTNAEATFAVDNCGADWNEQAAKTAESYMRSSSFSRQSLLEQLEYEGFTPEQAEYGVKSVGY